MNGDEEIAMRLSESQIETMAGYQEIHGFTQTASILREYVRLRKENLVLKSESERNRSARISYGQVINTIREKIKAIDSRTKMEDAMPMPWMAKASKWGMRDMEIYDAEGHRITEVNECYPPERLSSAELIPLAVNAIYEIKRILDEANNNE